MSTQVIEGKHISGLSTIVDGRRAVLVIRDQDLRDKMAKLVNTHFATKGVLPDKGGPLTSHPEFDGHNPA